MASTNKHGFALDWLRDHVMDEYRWSRDEHNSSFCDAAFIQYRLWKNYVEARLDPDDYHSNIGVPVVFPIIETAHAYLMAPWTQSVSLVNVVANEPAGMERAPKIQAYLNQKLRSKIRRSMSRHSLVTKSGLVFGTGTLKYFVRWHPKQRLLRRVAMTILDNLVPGGIPVGSRPGWVDRPAEGRIEIDHTDAFDWWKTPGTRFLEDADWTFEQSYLTHTEVQSRIQSGEWLPVTVEPGDAMGFDEYRQRREDLDTGYSDHIRSGQRSTRSPHRLIEAQGRFQVKESKGTTPTYQDIIVWILNEQTVVNVDLLPTYDGKPSYREWNPIMDPGGTQAISLIEHCRDTLLEINDLENILLDNLRKVVEQTLLVDPTSTKQREIYLGPAEINWIRNPHYAVKALEMGDLPAGAWEMMGRLFDLVQRSMGVPDYFAGLQSGQTARQTQTWHGMELITQLAGNRLQPLMASLDIELYQQEFEALKETAQQRMQLPVDVRLPGNPANNFATVNAEDMEGQFDYSYNTKAFDPSEMRNRDEFIQAMTELRGMEQGLNMDGYKIDYYELARLLLDKFDRAEDADAVIKQLPQIGPDMLSEAMLPAGDPAVSPVPGTPQPVAAA